MHSLDPIVWSTKSLYILSFLYVWQDTKKTLSELWSIGIEIQFKYLLLDKRIISTSDIYSSIQYFLFTYIPVSFLLTTVKNSKETRIKIYCIHAQFRCPIFDPLSKLLHRRAREKSRALVRPFFVAKPVQGVCVCSVWIRGSPSVGSRWKPLLKRSRRRWKSGIENWFQAGTELGGVARSGVADTGWWGAIRFAGVVGEGWQRQVMVYSYSQSGSGVRWGEIASCQAYTSLFFTQLIPDLSSRCIKRDYIRTTDFIETVVDFGESSRVKCRRSNLVSNRFSIWPRLEVFLRSLGLFALPFEDIQRATCLLQTRFSWPDYIRKPGGTWRNRIEHN